MNMLRTHEGIEGITGKAKDEGVVIENGEDKTKYYLGSFYK